MSIERTNRLKIALQKAKANLPEKEESRTTNKSTLGRLLNKPSSLKEGRAFLGTQPIHERPLIDAIAKETFGEDVEYVPKLNLRQDNDRQSNAQLIASRLKNMRERVNVEPSTPLGSRVGFSVDGKPLWASIIDEQRQYPSQSLSQELAPPQAHERLHHSNLAPSQSTWPLQLQINQKKTFKQWRVYGENKGPTEVCEAIIDQLGNQMNPLLMIGPHGTGKSHLLHATGQSVLRYYDKEVRIIRGTELISASSLPQDWHEALTKTCLLLIDDLHLVSENEDLASNLGHLIDHSLNLGIQVLATSLTYPDSWASSRLWDVMKHSSTAELSPVSSTSLALHIKRESSVQGLLLEDAHIMYLLEHTGNDWRSVNSSIAMLVNANQKGDVAHQPEDVLRILANKPKQEEQVHEQSGSSITLASDIVRTATDVIYSDKDIGGIELHSTSIDLPEDDWEPRVVSVEEIHSANDLIEQHLKTTLEELTPEAPSVLDADFRDRHLTHQLGQLEGSDIDSAVDVMVGIDTEIDRVMAERERQMVRDDLRLRNLESQMEALLDRTSSADANELIDIVDELRHIEHELGLVSEDAMEAFELEDEEAKNLVRLARIRPKAILTGEQE
ncbi:MAG: ATP-binding protein [Candidatus Poseidoniaceae archaeon]|nr:ATP-binding protein [Candidatus Poseidoniaceae archaeon]MBL6889698.1 ATP-binding protein [Candidatus Poseidoniaceae archaeon]